MKCEQCLHGSLESRTSRQRQSSLVRLQAPEQQYLRDVRVVSILFPRILRLVLRCVPLCITAVLNTSHSYSAVRSVYTPGPTQSSHSRDTTVIVSQLLAIDTTSPNSIVRANLQSFTTLVPGSIKQVTQKLAVGIKQVRQLCCLFEVYIGAH